MIHRSCSSSSSIRSLPKQQTCIASRDFSTRASIGIAGAGTFSFDRFCRLRKCLEFVKHLSFNLRFKKRVAP
ncbi:hypothetical protein HanPSC8_Chr15g0657241 [Helianthus annuus]|nr:hypothetical protein HanPSC8_Chr15g0657241 [Helianthus annuus]